MASTRAFAVEAPWAVIVYGPTEESGARLLADELVLVGIRVRRVPGGSEHAQAVFSSEPARLRPNAVVSIQPEGSSIWVKDPASHKFRDAEPVVVHPEQGESADSRALRSVELLRGQLLEGDAPPTPSSLPSERHVSLTMGPTFQFGNYVGVSWGLTADAAIWFRRFGVGPWMMMAPSRSAFRFAPQKISVSQTTWGLQVRGVTFASPTEFFTVEVAGRGGWRRMKFFEEKGMAADRFEGSSDSLVLGVAVGMSFYVTSHLRLGFGAGTDMGFPLRLPEDGPEPVAPPKKVPKEIADAQDPDVLLWTSGVVSLQF